MDTQNLLQPLWTVEPGRWDYPMAAHLLRRAGFGGTIEETEKIVAMGPQQAISGIVDFANQPNDLPPIVFGELTGPLDAKKKSGGLGRGALLQQNTYLRDMSPDQKRALFTLQQGDSEPKWKS